MGRVREMFKLNPKLHIDVMCPILGESEHDLQRQVKTLPHDINPDLWEKYGEDGENRLRFIEHKILPNALVTRYDFNWPGIVSALDLGMHKLDASRRYDAIYINDPMHLTNFMAMFHVIGGYMPKFFVHSHFVDLPSIPKFPKEASLWLGQCEAAIKADYNFWQCGSALLEFEREARKTFRDDVVDAIMAKSQPWDDGFSRNEITSPINRDNMRFTPSEWQEKVRGKIVVFFPNRISPSSGDYTNGMKFMFELLPQLRKVRKDFVVVCGNPNQKFTNKELEEKCGMHGYVSLVPDSFNRDEFKFVASHSNIAVGLYDKDAYGGTVARECIEMGCVPLWLNCNEYSSLAREAGWVPSSSGELGYPYVVNPDFSDFVEKFDTLCNACLNPEAIDPWKFRLQDIVRKWCSYEETTETAMYYMGLHPGI